MRLDAAAVLLLVANGELADAVLGEEVLALPRREGDGRVRAPHTGVQLLAVVLVRLLLLAVVDVVGPTFFVLALQ